MDLILLIAFCILVYLIIVKGVMKKSKKNPVPKPSDNENSSTIRTNPSRNSPISIKVRTYTTSNSDSESEEDSLATFNITSGFEEEKSNNRTIAKWLSPGDSVEVKGKTVSGGLFYFGGQLVALNRRGVESSLVDNYIHVIHEPMEYQDESLGYWPKYNTISPKARGAYLDWLSSNRDNPKTPIGYVFLYFYGLERRILVDSQQKNVDDSEYQEIFAEIKRLRNIYSESRSFKGYSTRLLETMCIFRPTIVTVDKEDVSHSYDALLFKYLLAKTVKSGQPISAEIAMLWLHNTPEYSLKTPARRCREEFSSLFISKYRDKFGDGIIVKPNKTSLKLFYQPASSTLHAVQVFQETLPDPSALKRPVNKLIPIADACIQELGPFSRYLGKQGASRKDMDAIMLLPDELANESNLPAIANFKQWAELIVSQKNGITTVTDFWSQIGVPKPNKLNKKETEMMVNLVSKAGFGIAPDINFHHAKPTLDGKVVLFPVGHEKGFIPSRAFDEVGMALRLGAIVASSDSHVHESEIQALQKLIDNDPKLNTTEKRSLHAYLKWRLNTPSNTAGLKVRIEKLGFKEKSLIRHILVSIALADGKIAADEIKQLEKLYTTLGLDRAQVTSDIHGLSSAKDLSTSTYKVKDEISKSSDTRFKLDEELIELHESETNDVQNMLNTIFADDYVEEMGVETPVSEEDDSPKLDDVHRKLFETLVTKDVWPRQAVEDMCKPLGLMVDGTIETINDWSYETLDAPILEDDGDILVDQEIVSELKIMKE